MEFTESQIKKAQEMKDERNIVYSLEKQCDRMEELNQRLVSLVKFIVIVMASMAVIGIGIIYFSSYTTSMTQIDSASSQEQRIESGVNK